MFTRYIQKIPGGGGAARPGPAPRCGPKEGPGSWKKINGTRDMSTTDGKFWQSLSLFVEPSKTATNSNFN